MMKTVTGGSKLGLLASAAICALAPAAASAQSTSAPPSVDPQASDTDLGGDIIVTAQRRSERLSEVPIAITALSADTMAKVGISDVRGMNLVTPGLNFQAVGASATPVIRGLGSTGTQLGDGSNVAIYVDGVYQPFRGANYLRFPDVERVEVLKGPQGTLYGRNAAGGAISITTLSPSFTPTGRLSVSYARFNEVEGSAFISGPVVEDKIAVSLAGDIVRSDGFRQDIYLKRKLGYLRSEFVRGKMLFTPTDALTVQLSAFYSRRSDLTTFGNQALDGNTAVRRLNPGILIANEKNTSSLDIVPYFINTTYGGNAKIDIDLGFATLTSLTAYENIKSLSLTDSDLTPASNSQTESRVLDRMVTQDLILTSTGDGPFSYVLGGSLYDEQGFVTFRSAGGLLVTSPNPPILAGVDAHVRVKAEAVFGELTYNLSDALKIIGGLRYTTERPSFNGSALVVATGQLGPVVRSNPAHFKKLIPRVTLQYKMTPELNAYATYSQGYKPGVVNPTGLQTTVAQPENVNAYEVGAKGAFGRTASFDFSAFYYDYKNLQVQAFGENATRATLLNVGKAEIYGAEANATLALTDSLQLRMGGAYTHGTYKEFVGAVISRPITDAAGVPIGGNAQAPGDVSGNRVVLTPRFSGNATLSYDAELANGGAVGANVTGSYVSRINYDPAGVFQQKGYALVNANLSYTLPGGNAKATLFGTNVFNAQPIASLIVSALATAVTYMKPATYGVKLEYLF